MTQDDFDGKRLRKSVMRKTVDYNASIIKAIEVSKYNFTSFTVLVNSLDFRIEYGNEMHAINVVCSLKVFMRLI